MLDDTYDDSREDSIRSMTGDFYNRRRLSTAVPVSVAGVLFMERLELRVAERADSLRKTTYTDRQTRLHQGG
jgi:hypothetical protein